MHRRYFRTAADALQITIFNKLPGGFLRLVFGHAQKPGYPQPYTGGITVSGGKSACSAVGRSAVSEAIIAALLSGNAATN